MKRRRILGAGLLAAFLATAAAAPWWYRDVYRPARFSAADPLALSILRSDARVIVTRDEWIELRPSAGVVDTGLVFYPAAECAPEGYAEPLRQVAASGYLVVIVPMPFAVPALAPDRAADVVAAFPEVRRWAIGGHAAGGAAAARFIHRHPGVMTGLILWDAYPATTDDLSRETLAVRQVHRLEANGLPPIAYRESNRLLPPQTDFTPVAGASETNYGRFIPAARLAAQPAGIAVEEQHRRIAAATVEFLSRLAAPRAPAAM